MPVQNLLKKFKFFDAFWEDKLPEKAESLIQKATGADQYGDGRGARAEIEIRSSLALTRATNVLAFSTFTLSVVTIVLVVVTALK